MLRRLLKWIAIVAGGMIGVLLIASVILVWITGSRLEERLEAIRAAGDPLSIAELARDPIPPERNAATFLRRAQDDIEAISKELMDVYGSDGYSNGSPSESELKKIQSALEAHPDVIPLVQQAANCADYDPELDYSLGPRQFMNSIERLSGLRSPIRLLKARTLLLKSQGDLEEALRNSMLIFRLCRHYDREPMLVGYLVGAACRGVGVEAANLVLRSGPVDKSAREALEAELARHDDTSGFQHALKSERVIGIENYQAIPSRNWWPNRAMWDVDQAAYLDLIDQHLSLASQPYRRVAATGLAAEPAPGKGAVLTQLVKPAVLAARQAADRVRAQIRCLRVLNAVQRLEEQGTAEPELSDLGLPKEATTDPFSGEPLQVKKRPDGWLIYAVGKDLKDDGGRVTDAGVGPLGWSGGSDVK